MIIAIMWVVTLAVTIRYIVFNYLQKHKPSKSKINAIFYVLAMIPTIKTTFKKIYSMQVYDEYYLKYNLSISMIEKLFYLLAIYIGLLLFTQELFLSIILMPIFILIIMKNFEGQVDKTYMQILQAIPDYISDLRNEFIASQSVKNSLSKVDRENILSNLIIQFRNLTTKDFNAELTFKELVSNNVPALSMLAMAIYTTDDLGDTGKSALNTPFIKDLTIISEEVESEIYLVSKRWGQFDALQKIFYISPVVLVIINWYVQANMTMITHLYNGLYGTIVKLISVAVWCIAYSYVLNLKQIFKQGKSDSNSIYTKIAHKFKKLRQILIPKKVNYDDMLDKFELNGSDLTPLTFYIKKYVYGIFAFIVSLLLISVALYFSRSNVRYSQSSFGLSGSTGITKEWAHIFQEIDDKFILEEENINDYTDMELADLYVGNVPELSTTKGLNNAKRIQEKYRVYKSMELHWYITIICLFIGIAAYFIPNILMIYTKKDREYMRSIDIKKLFTMLIIFSDTTFSAYKILSMMAIQCEILTKEIYFSRELLAVDPLQLHVRRRHIREDLSIIYGKVYSISDKLQPFEALSDAYDIKKNRITMEQLYEDQRIENERNQVLMLPVLVILFIVFLLIAYPLYNTAMSQINNAMSTW